MARSATISSGVSVATTLKNDSSFFLFGLAALRANRGALSDVVDTTMLPERGTNSLAAQYKITEEVGQGFDS
jgi:hypothetical protein